jgi:hypothetical protein
MRSFTEPTASEVDTAVAMILSSPVYATYFFDRLENPNWIAPLNAAGLFAGPPAAKPSDGGGTDYPIRLASKFLARMAACAPAEIAEILQGIKTENPAILRDILDAAGKMPIAIAATLVPTVCTAINTGMPEFLFARAVDFCASLASGGQMDGALELAEALFRPRFARGPDDLDPEGEYWYTEGLGKVVPLLATASPGQFLRDLCAWLIAAIAQKRFFGERPPTDGSDHWRPAIEEHSQNSAYDFASNLVGSVRDGFELAVESGNIELRDALRILAGHDYHVFARLRVHLINRFAERDPDLARATMMDLDLFQASQMWLWHEYAMLMHAHFPMLSPEQQSLWLNWVDRGPPKEELYLDTGTLDGVAIDQLRQTWVESWQATRLHWVADYMTGDRRAFYERVAADCEDPETYDFHFYSSSAEVGWRSPISVAELTGLSLADALNKIAEWKPSKGQPNRIGEATQGLAAAFGQYVNASAEVLSTDAEVLERRDPMPIYIFVRTFLHEMADAVKAGRGINLAAVLRLCKWVVEQPISGYGAYIPIDGVFRKLVDTDWQWARDAIAGLIREVCTHISDGSPTYMLSDYEDAILPLLKPLAEEPDKSLPEGEVVTEARLWTYDDFLTMAINTPRGKAMDAIVAYARWNANQIARTEQGQQFVPGGLSAMPDVRDRLNWHVIPENSSFEAFAVIGAYVGLLHWIDESWVKENVGRIFDLSVVKRDPTVAYGCAAWNSFLIWGHAHAAYYEVLRPQYIYAVENQAKIAPPAKSGRTPIHYLGEHLVLLYGRGNLRTSTFDDEYLLFSFLEAADSGIRSPTIAFVGVTLRQSGAVPEGVIARFTRLWEWYWPKFGEKDIAARPSSGLFGSWFRCEQFPIAWRLAQLEAVVEPPHLPEMADRVVERMAQAVEDNVEHVGVATRVLDRMIRSDKEGWRAYEWRVPAKSILRIAMLGGDPARSTALELIDHLGRRGYHEFGALLRLGQGNSEN